MIEFQEDHKKGNNHQNRYLYGIKLEIIRDSDEEKQWRIRSCTFVDIADDGNEDDCSPKILLYVGLHNDQTLDEEKEEEGSLQREDVPFH